MSALVFGYPRPEWVMRRIRARRSTCVRHYWTNTEEVFSFGFYLGNMFGKLDLNHSHYLIASFILFY